MSEHKPNGCCDFHRHIADGCCHCGDDMPVTAPRADLDELGRLLAEATPGPWEVMADRCVRNPERYILWDDSCHDSPNGLADGEMIAALVNAAPALLAEVADLRETVARVKALRDEWEHTILTGFCDQHACDRLARGNKDRFVADISAALDGAQ